jgi:hypothetical protein
MGFAFPIHLKILDSTLNFLKNQTYQSGNYGKLQQISQGFILALETLPGGLILREDENIIRP